MTNIHIEKGQSGQEVYFEIWYGKKFGYAIPRFCTFCGSKNLNSNKTKDFMDFKGIHCKDCGLSIHDCCTQPTHSDFVDFMKEMIK